MLYLQIMHEVMDNSTVFFTAIRMRLFLLLNKQELMITSNIAGSLSNFHEELYDRIPEHEQMLWRLTYSKASRLFPNYKASTTSTDLQLLYLFFLLFAFTLSCASVPQLCMKKWMWGLLAIKEHAPANPLFAHGCTLWEIESMRKCTTSWTSLW